jgi:type II secretory pathway component PulF
MFRLLRARALFYRALAQMLEAGLPVLRALETSSRTVPAGRLRRAVAGLKADIEHGGSVAHGLALFPREFPAIETRLLAAAEASGRLDSALRELADYLEELARLRRAVLTGLILPGVMLHAAALIVPLSRLFVEGSVAGYLAAVVAFLAPFWLAAAAIVAVFRLLPPATLAALVDPLPLVGSTWRDLDQWRVSRSVQMLTNAGVGVIAALRVAATLARHPRLAATLVAAAENAEHRGERVSTTLAASRLFPDELIGLWATGEESGKLDECLGRIADRAAERCQQRFQLLARWLPYAVYAAVAVLIAVEIIRLGARYVALLQSVE